MPLIQLLEVLIVVGVLLWLVNRFIPMQGSIKSILNGVVVIAVVLWLLNVFGLFHSLSRYPRRNVKDDEQDTSKQRISNHKIDTTQHGRHLPQGDTCENKAFVSSRNRPQFERICSNQFPNNHGRRAHGPTPTFRVNVVSRSVQAVNYKHRSGATKLDFAGTDLMPSANGQAKVESKKGSIEIEVEFGNLQKPTTFGNEYLTYILWAISPEGRAVNLGEVLVGDNHRSKLDVTTDLQAFALIVTAEPYYAVRQPSNVVVIENVVRDDTKGTTEAVNAKYELWSAAATFPPATSSTRWF